MHENLITDLRYCSEMNSLSLYKREMMKQAADAIEDLDNKLNLYRQGKISHWIPVSERLPEEDGKYLTVHTLNTIPPQPWIEVCWFAKNLHKVDKYEFPKKKAGFYQSDSEYGNYEVSGISHWMPLPEPPKDGET